MKIINDLIIKSYFRSDNTEEIKLKLIIYNEYQQKISIIFWIFIQYFNKNKTNSQANAPVFYEYFYLNLNNSLINRKRKGFMK
jgi:hypothetical protein